LSNRNSSFFSTIWDFLCSLKLTIITLILLAVTSIIGTVIRQNRSPQEYLEQFGETTYLIFERLQFFDMYSSWWFLSLLVLFTANLVACSIKRFPRVWKTVHEPVLVADDTLFRTMSNAEELTTRKDVGEVRDKLTAFFGKRFATPVVTEGEDGKVHLFAQKGAYSRFGVYITHFSIVIIFVGAIIGNVFGYKAFINIVEGTETSEVWPRSGGEPIDLGFTLRCDEFSVSFYEGSRRPKEYKSLITVIENGEVVKDKRPVIVNDPLKYKGIVFYQSSYGPAGDPVFSLRVRVRETGETSQFMVRQGQRMQLPGGGFVRVADFTPSFQNFGPAARLEVIGESGPPRSFIVLQAHPEFDAQRGGTHVFSLLDYQQRYYTGLQVAKDPGVWTVWVGCILLIVGPLIAFFMSHRRIWVTLQPLGEKTGIRFGGTAHRNQPAFELFFDEFTKDLKTHLLEERGDNPQPAPKPNPAS
jgi:cytochrome c biogenesis protein